MKRFFWIFLALSSPALANREGWGDARQKAERLERRGEWGAAAAWWEGAAEVLEAVSAPLSKLGAEESAAEGNQGAAAWWVVYGKVDAMLALEARDRAKAAAAKAGGVDAKTRATVDDFLRDSIAAYPENYYTAERYKLRAESLRAAGLGADACHLEATGHERWAERYEKVCVAWWQARGNAELVVKFQKKVAECRRLATAKREEALRALGGEAQDKLGVAILRRDVEWLRANPSPKAVKALVQFHDVEGVEAASHQQDFSGFLKDAFNLKDPVTAPEAWVALSAPRVEGPARDFATARLETAPDFAAKLIDGILVEYFTPGEPTVPAARLTAMTLDFDFEFAGPRENFPADGWSLRATGFFTLPADRVAEFVVQCDDGLRVRIDGRVVIDEWTAHPDQLFRRAPLTLAAGLHSLTLEYKDVAGPSSLRAFLAPARDEIQPLALKRVPDPEKR